VVEAGAVDDQPAPHGLPGFAAPVEQFVPAMTPYLELSDGRVIVAGNGADSIEPAADGRSLRDVEADVAKFLGQKEGAMKKIQDLNKEMATINKTSRTT
jgi:hypothetical protein